MGRITVCEEAPGLCAMLMTFCSVLLIIATLPLSLLCTVKVVQVDRRITNIYSNGVSIFQEYERAVVFRLGRLLRGGAKGPGVFFTIPCVDVYKKIDMRTATFEIPPQEVG
jgi:erythrocyte band 7 integral membrane protein